MSIAPGMSFTGSQVKVTAGAGTTPALTLNGIGFMANGSLALDTNAPSGSVTEAGFRMSNAGAIFATLTPNAGDVFVGGLRITGTGAVVYEVAAATLTVNGNPITANGRLATT